MKKGMQIFYTKFGNVYTGWKFEEMNFPNYTMVIQGTKLKDYRELIHNEKTLEKISEYGFPLANEAIEGIIDDENFSPTC